MRSVVVSEKLTMEARAKAMDWFRTHELPLIEGAGATVWVTVDEELDYEGRVQFRTVILKRIEGVSPTQRNSD